MRSRASAAEATVNAHVLRESGAQKEAPGSRMTRRRRPRKPHPGPSARPRELEFALDNIERAWDELHDVIDDEVS